MSLEELYSVKTAAKRLGGVSVWSVYAWLSQGRLQRTKIGRRTMISESELARFVREGSKSASKEGSR
jgi:excisionase family DNA binding protein